MSFLRTIRLAIKSILLHKLRSGLTVLGIVFGVFSVIAMLAIGEGASREAQRQVLALGATNVIVRSVKPPEDAGASNTSRVLAYGLTRDDYRILRETLPNLLEAAPIREAAQEFRHGTKVINGRLVGCTPAYRQLNNLQISQGRFLTDSDNDLMVNVAVIAHDVAGKLYVAQDPINKVVRVGENLYRIVGVTKPREATAAVGGSLAGQSYSADVYIPVRTFQARVGDFIYKRSAGSRSAEEIELNQITLKVRHRDDVVPTAEVVRETLAYTHARSKDYSVVVPLELLKQADQIRQIFNVVLGSIAAISLIVGGIGIMNIMLATVTERTREIGIRRALGAKQSDILRQFLTETIVLSGSGGVIGIIFGLLTPFAFGSLRSFLQAFVLEESAAGTNEFARLFTQMTPVVAPWSLPVAFLISVGIGVVFGVWPARNASRLDPIEALRHE
ncbi:ABC transporter permease [Stratiformator vulcanicus]|uniref:Macrolide export ATP-binding/permease protein MacB n=1 Tax=Stratiformator vulcanicus TaxID=2527980 RepID=A0A517QX25_9PLAN|nr:ABC transporter permease [Stratiformator vulcanicus]QDT36147.1 Macrolide export ATP-binding/permease protein MacB [Stratiformator vulcanicus]